MIEYSDSTQIGFLQKPHGVKGEIALTLGEGIYAENIDPEFLLLDIDNGLVPFYVESYRVKSNKSIYIKLETVDSENKAKDLSGTQVYLDKDDLEESDEYIPIALKGYKVNDKIKGYVGTIIDLQEISDNPIFILDYEGKEVLMPIHEDFILNIDDGNKTLETQLPEGLVDLYLDTDSQAEF